MKRLVYPDRCATCGARWGDHITEHSLHNYPNAHRFVAKPGEIEKPTLIEDDYHPNLDGPAEPIGLSMKAP